MRHGTPIYINMAAKPTSKKAKLKHATVTVFYAVDGDGCPTQEEAEKIANAYLALTEGALVDVLNERRRQFAKGFDFQHDLNEHSEDSALPKAAVMLADPGYVDDPEEADDEDLGWAVQLRARHAYDRRRQLVIAAALLVAEIERMDRVTVKAAEAPNG